MKPDYHRIANRRATGHGQNKHPPTLSKNATNHNAQRIVAKKKRKLPHWYHDRIYIYIRPLDERLTWKWKNIHTCTPLTCLSKTDCESATLSDQHRRIFMHHRRTGRYLRVCPWSSQGQIWSAINKYLRAHRERAAGCICIHREPRPRACDPVSPPAELCGKHFPIDPPTGFAAGLYRVGVLPSRIYYGHT